MNDETLFLYLNNELESDEQKKVEKWIAANPEKYEEIKKIRKKTEPDFSASKPNMDRMWRIINSEMQNTTNQKKNRKLTINNTFLKYAAILILSLGLISYYVQWKMNHIEWVEYASDGYKTEDIVLPDGSNITLNKESKLSYKKQFLAADREVVLKGEAFFQVQKNPKKPFIISVNNTMVKVLGTSFNINATGPSGNVLVSVKTGKVMFYKQNDTENTVYLNAGDIGVFLPNVQKIKKTENMDQNYLAWKTGILLFSDNTLPEVCETLNKYYNARISIDDSALSPKKLTARYQNKSLPEILELLKIALDIRYSQKDDKIKLTSN
jgi:transmembrane sensor